LAVPVKKKAPGDSLIAIDFGTHATRVACWRGESAVTISDATTETEIPAVLLLSPAGGMMAGSDARVESALFPGETLLSPKTLLTADPAELEARRAFFPHGVGRGLGQMAQVELGGRPRSAVEIVALYLAHVRRQAELTLERPVPGAVLTVPVSYSPFERQALRVAARLAGFSRVRLIDEPTAAALAWLDRGLRGRVVSCVWGAGHFGATLLELQEEIVTVISSVGSSAVGGERVELALANDFLRRLQDGGAGRLEHEAHVARHVLAATQRAVREIATAGRGEMVLRLQGRDKAVRHAYGVADLAPWLEPDLPVVAALGERLLADAGLKPGDLDALLLAGGMTRLPAVAQHLETVFGRKPLEGVDPLEAVVQGALVRARFLDHEVPGPLVLDALPASLGLQAQNSQTLPLLDRGEAVPASRTELFTTYLERQTEVGVALFSHRGLQWEPLAQVEVTRLPSLKEGQPQIEVTFAYDEDATLSVEAREITKTKPLGAEVRPARGLSAAQAAALLQELPAPPESGFDERLRETLRERGRMLLTAVRAAMQAHPGAVTRDEKQLLAGKTQDLEETLEANDLGELRSAIRELHETAQPLLQRLLEKQLETLLC
jgi:molecular chaperone DnaK (HSP70)